MVKDLCQYATNKGFTHLVILTEKQKACNGYDSILQLPTLYFLRNHANISIHSKCRLLISHLPYGPTAFMKVRNCVLHLHACSLCTVLQHGNIAKHNKACS